MPATKVPTTLLLDRTRPEALIDYATPLELARAVETITEWTPRRLTVVDEVLSNWVADTIARPNDEEGLAALESGIARILDAPASRAAGINQVEPDDAPQFAQRWRAFSDAVRARHLKVEERAPERVRGMKHVSTIENLIRSGAAKQSEIQSKMQLTPSRLSQVLSLMESNGLIERRSEGKEKIVSVPLALKLPAQTVTHNPTATARGASWLKQAA